jgi:urease accessory protein
MPRAGITTAITITMTSRATLLHRSSPRKRGPRLDSRLRGNERTDAASLGEEALYRLMSWLSPAYPVGAFSYSSGIEWAVEAGDITNAESLRLWLEAMLSNGSGINDGIFFAHAYRAIAQSDDVGLVALAELAAAFVPTRERQQETLTLGRAFMEVTLAAWPCPALTCLQALCVQSLAYPIALGAACAGHAIALEPALHAFLTALCTNWISAGVRLIPLGHTDGQRTIAALEPAVGATARRALAASLDDLGSACFRADIASARHETQYTRLFRS